MGRADSNIGELAVETSSASRRHLACTLCRLSARRRSVDDFDRDAEHITGTALGADVAWLRRIRFELAPQSNDLHVDRSVIHVIVMQARHVEKLIPGKNAVRCSEQNNEQAEFAVAERNHVAIAAFRRRVLRLSSHPSKR
jgi:hypothetical protein